MKTWCVAFLLLAQLGLAALAQPVRIMVQTDQPGARINPAMWGIFFEDINSGADGGLYAELVKNRSFEFADPLMGWTRAVAGDASGRIEVATERPLNANNPHFLRVVQEPGAAELALVNEGFGGMGVRQGEYYRFSVHARSIGGPPAAVRVELLAADGRVLGRARAPGIGTQWKPLTARLRSSATDPKARLKLAIEGAGMVDLDMISLFPARTWKGRANGLRPDLVQMLADLKPGFLRFPGGCIVEGRDLSTRYQWKTTVGSPESRRLIVNRWNDEFKHRPAPDYFQTFGLGFYEYFLLSEDLGAQPLPILNCGMACQFNSGELAPLDQLDPYIQDALDLIEFANGPLTSRWGGLRASLGHPRPFGLTMLGIGNEQWGPQYVERYAAFAKVLKARHPEVQLVSSAGPRPDDDLFHFLWPQLRALKADIVDEHCYATPDWFLNHAGRYDRYDRQGPKVFMGEYAAQSVKTVSADNRNDWGCALAEAAYMTGLERNADVVALSSYAPLFGHEERWQWRPNLIWFDNLSVYGTPSYYVQQLFSLNRGDRVLPTRTEDAPTDRDSQARFYASATLDTTSAQVILKVVNATAQPVEAWLDLAGTAKVKRTAQALILSSPSLNDENSLASPRRVAPVSERWRGVGPAFGCRFTPFSLTVVRFNVQTD
jgi:alpha-L-arabinofuranosidase